MTAQSRCEVKMTGDLLGSALCKEEDELRQNIEEWNQAALKLEMLMNELVNSYFSNTVKILSIVSLVKQVWQFDDESCGHFTQAGNSPITRRTLKCWNIRINDPPPPPPQKMEFCIQFQDLLGGGEYLMHVVFHYRIKNTFHFTVFNIPESCRWTHEKVSEAKYFLMNKTSMFAHISYYIYLLSFYFYLFRLSTVFPSVQAACKRRENSLQVRNELKHNSSKNVFSEGLYIFSFLLVYKKL